MKLMAEHNAGGGINCTYYDYTYHSELKNIVLKLSRNQRSLLIMSKSIANQRKSVGCCGGSGIASQKSSGGSAGCAGPLSQNNVNIKVSLDSLSGFLIGPQSVTFEALKEENPSIIEDLDEWKYVSLCSHDRMTYDFVIKSR